MYILSYSQAWRIEFCNFRIKIFEILKYERPRPELALLTAPIVLEYLYISKIMHEGLTVKIYLS